MPANEMRALSDEHFIALAMPGHDEKERAKQAGEEQPNGKDTKRLPGAVREQVFTRKRGFQGPPASGHLYARSFLQNGRLRVVSGTFKNRLL